ncbi:MAG: hypothetical protein HY000_12550 [Planctomycetes bacterium]|nr:hypothetical protein [Planctomycetota bacterium]
MGLLAKLFGRRDAKLDDYVLRLVVRGPTGQTRHQFVKFEARSLEAAIQQARRRAAHENVLRWKLVDGRTNRELASWWPPAPGQASSVADAEEVTTT